MKKTDAIQRIPALVIAHDEQIRESIRFNLYLDGFEVEVTGDIETGIETEAKNKPSLILIDTDDQIQAVKLIKTNPKTQNIPVILLTESSSMADIDKLFDAGADDYTTKPFNRSELGKILKFKLKKCQQKISRPQQQLGKISVLVIDDDTAIHEIIEKNLTREVFDVHKANDGQGGIEAAASIKPDLILLDIMMPGMNGLEVLSTLKHGQQTSDAPVFMMTAEKLIGDIERAFEIGADDYLLKPIHGPKLGSMLREKLEKLKAGNAAR
ncbi:MAG: response regulator [Candidatus Brocadiia bacterium]|nr:MAG: response regulator [Candidatus Brocadiia bacterium]